MLGCSTLWLPAGQCEHAAALSLIALGAKVTGQIVYLAEANPEFERNVLTQKVCPFVP